MNQISRIDRPNAPKRATNISLRADLIAEAKALGVIVSQACELGLEQAVKAEKERRWLAENMAAIEATNAWVEDHGLPLEKSRLF